MKNNSVNFEGSSSKIEEFLNYDHIFLDTSVFFGPIKENGSRGNFHLEDKLSFYDELENLVSSGESFYIVPSVRKELRADNSAYKGLNPVQRTEDLLMDLRMCSIFDLNDKILDYRDLETHKKNFYDILSKFYGPEAGACNIEKTDQELVYTAFSSEKDKSVAIMTNDSGIMKVVDSLNKRFNSGPLVDVYKRVSRYRFEKWNNN